METVENFILNYTGEQRNILLYFHHLLKDLPKINSKISYNIPFYYGNKWICYLNPDNKGGVELAFTRGNELSNTQGLLESKSRKQVSSITFYEIEDIPIQEINEIIQEAILLDETTPKPVK